MLNRPINRWWVVVAGHIGTGLGAGLIMNYGFGILAQSMIGELGWHREVVSNLFGMFLLGSGLGAVALGWLIARYGIRPPAVLFVLTFSVCFAAVAVSPPVPAVFLLLFLAIGVAGAACTAMPYAVAVSGFFDAHRGLALGLVVAGSGVGGFLLPHIAEVLVGRLGWRGAFAVIGLGTGLIVLLGLIFLVRTPPGVVARRRTAETDAADAPHSNFQIYLRSRPFWFIALPIVAISIAAFGAFSSFVFLFADRGIPTATITTILSVTGLISLLGRLLVGYAMDRIFAPYVTATVFALTALAMVLLALVPSTVAAFVAAALVGLAIGAEADILTFLISRYFGLREFSRLVGIIWVAWAWGGGVGTEIVGLSHSYTGSYSPAFLFFALLVALAAILVCFIGPYRHPVQAKPAQESYAQRSRPEPI